MDDSLKELFPDFLQESYDQIVKVQATLKNFASAENKSELLENVFRGVHTVKGGAGMLHLDQLSGVAHELETTLGSFRGNISSLTADKISGFQKMVDQIEDLLKEAESSFYGGGEQQAPVTSPARMTEVEASSVSQANVQNAPAPVIPPKDVVKTPAANVAVDVLRVPLPHVSNALNNIWEVFLIRNQLEYLIEQERPHLKSRLEFLQSWELLDSALKRNITELEGTLMAMRMSSVKSLFTRMEKVVRSYLESVPEKSIVFETTGEETELDKKVIDMLGEPLIHLVRNAMDHGVETREERIAAGKSGQGKIVLSAEAVADRVLVRIKDDGKGINGAKLLEKAQAKGLDVSAFRAGAVSPVEIIFMPGFSTAEKVTDVSGRGVGMDAVRHSIAALGGSVEIETVVGKGTTFSISLPLSLSVIPATVFCINSTVYGANLGAVVEVCRVPAEEIQRSNGSLHFHYRGRYIPCFDLMDYISTESASTHDTEASIFISKYKHELVALKVSDVMENTEVVVKPLPPLLPKFSIVQGMSILPTGKAIFILSFDALIDAIRSGRLRSRQTSRPDGNSEGKHAAA